MMNELLLLGIHQDEELLASQLIHLIDDDPHELSHTSPVVSLNIGNLYFIQCCSMETCT